MVTMMIYSCVIFMCILLLPVHNVGANRTTVNWCKDLYIVGDDQNEFCRYRDSFYPRELFLYISGLYCYTYGENDRFEAGPYKISACYVEYPIGQYYQIPYTAIDAERSFYYDYRNETARKAIRKSFVNERYYSNWENCAQAAMDCCKNRMTNTNINPPNGTYCPVVWDGWSCFSEGALGTTAEEACPNYIYSTDTPCVLTSEKQCFEGGKWNDTTNYVSCGFQTQMPSIQRRYYYHIYALYVTIAICLPAIVIFYCYPSLRITRNILHRNLLIAITVRNVLIIMSTALLTLPALDGTDVLLANSVACRVLSFLNRASINAMFACMLVDGFYLHKIIAAVFRKDPPMSLLYGVVAVFTLLPALIWAVVKAMYSNDNCWIVDPHGYQWILDGSRYLMLGINAILLIDIIRVLLWKLKRNNGTQHTKTTIRATLILLPLFGVQFIMMSQRPVNVACYWDDVFYYASYTMDSAQGIIVSLFYCYFNKEVQALLGKSYQTLKREIEYKFPNVREEREHQRRITAATYVGESEVKRTTIKLDKITENPSDQNANVQNWLQHNCVPQKEVTSSNPGSAGL